MKSWPDVILLSVIGLEQTFLHICETMRLGSGHGKKRKKKETKNKAAETESRSC